MAAYFLDSSAAVKLYVRETGTEWLSHVAAPEAGHSLFVARVTLVEIAAALYRRVQGGTLAAERASEQVALLREHAQRRYRVIEITASLLEEAINLAEGHRLRGYDCVQLAAILTLSRTRAKAGLEPPILVSADEELNDAARRGGLVVEDPNVHGSAVSP